ncbi:MAG: hypothetical protein BWY82_03034 [Verrucomicrobia bacterium ADurb.Bin474]|nr:MAG: hypothetical protein BWY82_03034 [Verrucomicrobia bacterium ADurb.Bin474]
MVVKIRIRSLDTDLRRVQTGIHQPPGHIAIDQRAVADQVYPHVEILCIPDQIRQKRHQRRLPAREADRGHSRFLTDLTQHFTKPIHPELSPPGFFARAIASGIAKPASQITPVGQRHFRQHRPLAEGRLELLRLHCWMPSIGIESTFHLLPNRMKKQSDFILLPAIQISHHGPDGSACQQFMQYQRPRGIQLHDLIGSLDQQMIPHPHINVGLHSANVFVHPIQLGIIP